MQHRDDVAEIGVFDRVEAAGGIAPLPSAPLPSQARLEEEPRSPSR